MDFSDKINALARRTANVAHLQTEEATKMALVVPFIDALGYDVYDPLEVVPEYTSDVGIKKGEKVDYAIFKDGEPIMLFWAWSPMGCSTASSATSKPKTRWTTAPS